MLTRLIRLLVLLLVCIGAQGSPSGAATHHERSRQLPSWKMLDTGRVNDFRGLSAVDDQVAWVSGYDGMILRTTDGGRRWRDVSPAGASKLEFRDISAFSRDDAVAMGAGGLRKSRLYVTHDGGKHWARTYTNRTKGVFFDCMSFFDAQRGLLMSDPVDGKFRILATADAGDHWAVLPDAGMPRAHKGEYGFAASGECLTTLNHDAWFGSGGSTARVFHSADGGLTWDVSRSHLKASPSAGVFGLAFQDSSHGVAVGGDYADPTVARRNAASFDADGWSSAQRLPGGYRSGVAFVPGTAATFIAVGLTGSDLSTDGGRSWRTFGHGTFDTVTCTATGACWASGDKGRVAKLRG